ncbi:MAG: S24 family peptidase [Burkholderiaceae bacterium]
MIAALISSAGLTPNAVAARAKGSQPQLHRYLSGESREPRRATLAPFARFFRVPVDAFYNEAMAAQIARERGLTVAGALPPARRRPAGGMSPAFDMAAGWSSAIPVTGQIEGTVDGYVEIAAATADHAELACFGRNPNAYALRVHGDSMADRIMSGDHIVVEPGTPPQPGDLAVIVLEGGRRAVRKLLYIRDGEVRLAPFNDGQRGLLLRLADVAQMHKIVGIVPR